MVIEGGKIRKFLIIFLLFVTGCSYYGVERLPPGKTYQQLANDTNECAALAKRLDPDIDITLADDSIIYANCLIGKGYNVKKLPRPFF